MDAPYAKLEQLEPGIARVLAHNPSAFTYYGTQTYVVGDREVAVIDPGPDLPEHLDALSDAVGARPVVAIMCTHTHRDHSPAARPLAERTGALIIGCAPLALETVGPRADAAFDGDYAPDRAMQDGEQLEVKNQNSSKGDYKFSLNFIDADGNPNELYPFDPIWTNQNGGGGSR